MSRPILPWLSPVVLLFLLHGCAENEEAAALGTLERDRYTLVATASEVIVQQPIAEGRLVRKGEVVVQLDTTRQAAAVARAALTESQQNLARAERLVSQNIAARAELDGARALHDSNAARLRDAEAQLALLRAGTREEELRQAEAQLQSLEAALANERLKLEELTLRAPLDALLDSLPWEVGERVNPSATVAVLLSAGAPHARVYLPETQRQRVAVGDSVQVQVDGVAQPLGGTVRWIALEPSFTPYYALTQSERSRLVYLMEIDLPDDAANLPAGLPAQLLLP